MRHALAHLTSIPVSRPRHAPRPSSLIAFPLVGAVVGVLWVVVGRITALALGPAVAAGAILLADVWITRALHLDGLASIVDATSGAEDPEDVAMLAREAAVAAPGAATIVALSLVRFGMLVIAASPPGALLLGLVPLTALRVLVAPAAGRMAMVVCYALVPPRSDEPEAFGQPPLTVVLLALGITLVVGLAAGPRGPVAVLLAAASGAAVAWWWRRRAGELIGEVPAAAALIGETVALAVVYAL
jgi:adenosylcobinamide-GDP ribazoletransferase